MSNVVSLKTYRDSRTPQDVQFITEEFAYRAKILSMDRVQLLEEMVRFQEERKAVGELTPAMMYRGRHLFRALEEAADSQELKILSRSYRRHLEYEIAALKESIRVP